MLESLNLQDIALLVATIAIIAAAVYNIHKSGKKHTEDGATDMLLATTNILIHIDEVMDAIDEATVDIGGINAKDYATSREYKEQLVKVTGQIIEAQLTQAGLTIPAEYKTLIELSTMIIERIIDKRAREARLEALAEERANKKRMDKALDINNKAITADVDNNSNIYR